MLLHHTLIRRPTRFVRVFAQRHCVFVNILPVDALSAQVETEGWYLSRLGFPYRSVGPLP